MNLVFSKYHSDRHLQCNVLKELKELRSKRKEEEEILLEARNILKRSVFNPKNIFNHLDLYYQTDQLLDDEELEQENIYTIDEIKKIAVLYRMKFMDIVYYKNRLPSVAEIKIEYLNDTFHKKISGLKILSFKENFEASHHQKQADYGILFAPTINGHYYLIHQWGNPVPKSRKYLYFPLRSFETLALCVILFTLIVDLILPTQLITLDRSATYWSGYRLGVFFHLLIFFGGLTMFFVVGFFRNVSENNWRNG